MADRIFVGKAQGHEALVHNRHLLSGAPAAIAERAPAEQPQTERRPSEALVIGQAVRPMPFTSRRRSSAVLIPTRGETCQAS